MGYGDYLNKNDELDYDNLNVYNEDMDSNLDGLAHKNLATSSLNSNSFTNLANTSSNLYYNTGVDNYYFINDVQKIVRFKTGDLYYSIHDSTLTLNGYKREDGKWIINARLDDTYDFTKIQTFMDKDDWSSQAGIGTISNDAAVISQKLGAINPYKVTVDFWTTR